MTVIGRGQRNSEKNHFSVILPHVGWSFRCLNVGAQPNADIIEILWNPLIHPRLIPLRLVPG
jgi:hypothetical protein